jgi:hypothetical protein
MVHYDPKLDRSEEMGWSKVCDEAVPTEQEQAVWGQVTVIATVFFAALALIVA